VGVIEVFGEWMLEEKWCCRVVFLVREEGGRWRWIGCILAGGQMASLCTKILRDFLPPDRLQNENTPHQLQHNKLLGRKDWTQTTYILTWAGLL
jgi:hypothetical protein